MIASRGLVLLSNLFQAFGCGFELLLHFLTFRPQIRPFIKQRAVFGGEGGDLSFACQKRAAFFVDPSAIDHALGGDDLATLGGKGQIREFPLECQRLLEIGDEDDIAQQVPNENLDVGGCVDFFRRPGKCAARKARHGGRPTSA